MTFSNWTYGAEWVTNGPYGGQINTIVVNPTNPNIVFAGAGNGLFRSTDGGETWFNKLDAVIGAIAFDMSNPNIVYAAYGQLHKSFDGGESWFVSGVDFGEVHAITFDPLDATKLYIGCYYGLYKSTPLGFAKVESFPADKQVSAIAIDPDDSNVIYAGTQPTDSQSAEIYKSTDAGTTWSLVLSNIEFDDYWVTSIFVHPQDSHIIYAGTAQSGLLKSGDGGQSWQQILHPDLNPIMQDNGANVVISPDSDTLYVCSYGLYLSTDAGTNWAAVSEFTEKWVNEIAISPSEPSIMYVATNQDGVYKSTDGGGNWKASNQGLPATCYFVVAHPKNAGRIFAASTGGVYESADSGVTWELIGLAAQEVRQILFDPANSNILLAASSGGVYKTVDGDKSWAQLLNSNIVSIAIPPSNPKIIYVGTPDDFYKGIDGGNFWKQIDMPQKYHIYSIAVDSANLNIVYVYMYFKDSNVYQWGLWKSADGGSNWEKLRYEGDGWLRPQKVAADPTVPNAVYLASDNGLDKSTDGGKTWQTIPLGEAQAVAFDHKNSNVIYVATGNVVHRSDDKGATFKTLGDVGAYVRAIAADRLLNGVVYAATDGGVYVYKETDDTTPPATPQNLQSTIMDGDVELSWQANTEDDLAGYKVYYGISQGNYPYSVDVGNATSCTLKGLTAPVYYIAVVAYDTSFNQSPPSEEQMVVLRTTSPSEKASFRFNLPPGLHMISLPLRPDTPFTARSFAEKLGATIVVEYDEEENQFFAFLPSVATTDGFTIKGGFGYIVNLSDATDVTFTGTAWNNAAPNLGLQSVWAFAVGGMVSGMEEQSLLQPLTVTVTNLRTGATSADMLGSAGVGRFTTAFISPSHGNVAQIGDVLEITLTDALGKDVSPPIQRKIQPQDLINASMVVHLDMRDAIPAVSALGQNYPNPFNPETWIPYQLAHDADVVLRIYDISGKLVKRLHFGNKPAGMYMTKERAAHWNGKNNLGEHITSGIYFYEIEAGAFRALKKMIVVR